VKGDAGPLSDCRSDLQYDSVLIIELVLVGRTCEEKKKKDKEILTSVMMNKIVRICNFGLLDY